MLKLISLLNFCILAILLIGSPSKDYFHFRSVKESFSPVSLIILVYQIMVHVRLFFCPNFPSVRLFCTIRLFILNIFPKLSQLKWKKIHNVPSKAHRPLTNDWNECFEFTKTFELSLTVCCFVLNISAYLTILIFHSG